MVYALVRKLYYKALGFEASNMREVIPYKTTAGAQNSGGHTITVKYSNNMSSNTKNQDVIAIGDGESIVSVGDLIINMFKNVASNSDGWKNARLLWIDLTDTTTGISRAHMDLTGVKVTLYSKSDLKLQNVTVPYAAATTEDNVSNVPLHGRSYHMKNWCPVPSDQDGNFMVPLEQTGVITFRSSQFVGSQYETWKEPPPKKCFVNCSGSYGQHLEPGAIKTDSLMTRVTMSLERFLLALSTSYAFGNSGNKSVRIGQHTLFAMERLLQVAGTLPVQMNYEVNYFTGVSVSARNKRAIMQKVTFATQSNLQP